MDINIVTMNRDLSCNYDFGIYAWTSVIQSTPPNGTTVKLDDVEKFKRGATVLFSSVVVGDNFSPVSDANISDDLYVITESDIQTRIVTLDRPIRFGLQAGFACIKMDKDASQVKTTAGIKELFQTVQKFLLTTRGSDSFDPEYGAKMYDLLWKVSPKDMDDARAAIIVEIKSAEKKIMAMQKKAQPLYKDEMLTSIIVRDVSFDYNIQRWRIDLVVLSEAGTSVEVQI